VEYCYEVIDFYVGSGRRFRNYLHYYHDVFLYWVLFCKSVYGCVCV